MTTKLRFCFCCFLAGLAVMLGCSSASEKTYSVKGVVTLDGKPLDGGTVLFELIEPGESGRCYTARGGIGSDGSCRLSTFGRNDGAPAGRYRVAVFAKQGEMIDDPNYNPPPIIPPKYSSMTQSGLEFEVSSSGKNHFQFNLQSN